jgi:hypothetical protein
MPIRDVIFTAAAIVALGMATASLAQTPAPAPASPAPPPSPPDLSGTYQCQPDPSPCAWSGNSPTISQNGKKLQVKNEKGETADATLTSDITISAGGPMNSLGIVRGDHSIDWSDGTKWHKP